MEKYLVQYHMQQNTKFKKRWQTVEAETLQDAAIKGLEPMFRLFVRLQRDFGIKKLWACVSPGRYENRTHQLIHGMHLLWGKKTRRMPRALTMRYVTAPRTGITCAQGDHKSLKYGFGPLAEGRKP